MAKPEPALDEASKLITVWDRKTFKPDALTKRTVPDETKRIPLWRYENPRPAEWPAADYIVGNPPFLGPAKMREALGDGYTETLRQTYPEVSESSDFVMYWWHKAAGLVRQGKAKRFGFITTNSLRQTFSRRVVEAQLTATPPLSILFAIPDHPWVDTVEGAAVRIAMTAGTAGQHLGELLEVTEERPQEDGSAKVTFRTQRGKIQADLTVGADVVGVLALKANDGLACPGVKLHGAGFIVPPEEAKNLGLGQVAGLEKHIRPYRNGKDLNDTPRGVMVIDLFGLTAEEVRQKFPAVYQHVLTRVKPEREAKGGTPDGSVYAKYWWLFGKPRKELRESLAPLNRYIATTETSKHRFFQFLDHSILPDNKLIVIAVEDAFFLGVMSSRIHVLYSLAAGSWLGVGNDPVYVKSRCFDPFPFPACDDMAKEHIRKLAEELDAHRKCAQAKHPGLTLTGMYNVLEKLRANTPLTAKEKSIHGAGLVSVLRQLHDDLDAAVFAAYGWPAALTDAEILERVVMLNAQRVIEEASGHIRWLRPEYQNPVGSQVQPSLSVGPIGKQSKGKPAPSNKKQPWPKDLSERVKLVSAALSAIKEPATPAELANRFARADAQVIAAILEALCTLGHARRGKTKGTYLP